MVTYLSGGRIQGSSAAVVSPDVSITSASGWNTDNATSVTIDSSGIITGGGSSANDRIYYDFYSALGNNYIGSTFTLEWAMKRTSSSGQDTRPLGLTSGTTGMDDLGTSMNALSSFEDTNWNPYYRYGTTDSSGGGAIESPSQGTWYYMRMWRDGNVLKLEAYTDEDRDSQFYSSMSYGSDLSGNVSWSGNGNLRFLMSSTKASAGANHGYIVKDIKLWNNKQPSTNGSAGKDFKEVDEKVAITDIPTGIRYEETDTRTIFRYGTDLVSGANLKVYLKFDEASGNIINVAGDVIGNDTLATGGNLTQSGGTYAQSTPSELGNGLLYDGTDDDGVFSTGSNTTSQFNFLHNTTANFTLCVWLKFPNSVTSNETLIDTYNGNDANVGMRLNTSPQGHFNITVARGQGNTFVIYTDGNPQLYIPTDNAWHFYCFRYDYTEGSDALIYSVDNATSGTYYEEFALGWYGGGTPNTAVNDNAYQAMYLGTKNGSAYFMNAVYAEFSLWNRRLTPAEVTQIYNSGDGFQLDTGLAVWKEKGTA